MMTDKRLLTLAFTLMLTAVVALAQTSGQRLVVWQKDGQKVYFDLSEEPKTTFSNGMLIITTKTMQTSYHLNTILRYTHEGVSSSVGEMSTHDLTVKQTDEGITLKNVSKNTVVRMYDTAGRLLESKTSDGSSTIAFSLTGRPAGVYLVNLNDQTFKITKR